MATAARTVMAGSRVNWLRTSAGVLAALPSRTRTGSVPNPSECGAAAPSALLRTEPVITLVPRAKPASVRGRRV